MPHVEEIKETSVVWNDARAVVYTRHFSDGVGDLYR